MGNRVWDGTEHEPLRGSENVQSSMMLSLQYDVIILQYNVIIVSSDDDECWHVTCPDFSMCVNTDGSYVCQCHYGYQAVGSICEGLLISLSFVYLYHSIIKLMSG